MLGIGQHDVDDSLQRLLDACLVDQRDWRVGRRRNGVWQLLSHRRGGRLRGPGTWSRRLTCYAASASRHRDPRWRGGRYANRRRRRSDRRNHAGRHSCRQLVRPSETRTLALHTCRTPAAKDSDINSPFLISRTCVAVAVAGLGQPHPAPDVTVSLNSSTRFTVRGLKGPV